MTGTKYVLGPDINLGAEEFYDEDGSRITPARADEIAKDVLTQAGKRGRRSLTGKASRSPQVTVRVTPKIKQELAKRAKARGVKPSEIAREALEKYLAS